MTRHVLHTALAAILGLSATSALADHHNPLDACVKASQQKHPGKMTSLSSEIEDGKAQFEIDIHGNDGFGWEVECNAATGKINRVEREIKGSSTEFTSKAKLRLDEAMKLALDKYPGEIVNTEYDIEDDGEVSYEFIIRTTSGKMIEIEVDATDGKLAGEEEILYHIGGR